MMMMTRRPEWRVATTVEDETSRGRQAKVKAAPFVKAGQCYHHDDDAGEGEKDEDVDYDDDDDDDDDNDDDLMTMTAMTMRRQQAGK